MAAESLVYSNARVRAMENSLLSHEKITRMTYATTLEEAVKILYESNYAGGLMLDNPYEYEQLLHHEDSRVTSFMRDAMPKNSGLECFLVKNDYHNAKAIFKGKLVGGDVDYMLLPQGLVSIDIIKQSFETDNYFSLPKHMSDAIKEIRGNGIEAIAPRKLDVALDKAMFKDITERVSKANSKCIRSYWQVTVDLSNVSTLIRMKSVAQGDKLLKECLMDGGEISKETLIKYADIPLDNLVEKLRFTSYGKIIEAGVAEYKKSRTLVAYEREWDNYLLNLFRTDRHNLFTVSPIAGFYVAKKTEQKVVRLILVCLKNKVDVSQIKQRLREIYA